MSALANVESPGVGVPTQCILCVDDEPNILTALRRVFRPYGYRMLAAASGAEALQLLERESVHIVISDMRMPGMDGSAFLEQVCNRWPNVVRLLLTGHSDVEATIGAINRGEIHRYISKPWDENDLLLIVRHAFERNALEQEKRRLEELTRSQNVALQEFESMLERKVDERTAALKQTCDALTTANSRLTTSFFTSIKVFSNLIELREAEHVGHSRRVADLGRQIAVKMALGEREVHDIFIAGLLHDVGRIGLPDAILRDQATRRKGDGSSSYRKYPLRSEQALMPLDELRDAARIVRSHRECFDGRGFPDAIAGTAIPLGARILSVAKDYDGARIGIFSRNRMTAAAALADISQGRGTRYDPDVVDAFVAVIGGTESVAPVDIRIAAADLAVGMALSRDLVMHDGVLLLAADRLLDDGLVACIRDYQETHAGPLAIYVRGRTATHDSVSTRP